MPTIIGSILYLLINEAGFVMQASNMCMMCMWVYTSSIKNNITILTESKIEATDDSIFEK